LIWTFGVCCERYNAIKYERWDKLKPFTSFSVIHDSKRLFCWTMIHVEQIFTNIIIWRESYFQPVFSANVRSFGYLVSIVCTGNPLVLLDKKDEWILHHLRHFLLFTSQNAILVQIWLMSSKHIRISLFWESHVSRPCSAQILWRSTNHT
jgi:hypothetical protein